MATKFGGKNPCPERNALLGNAANATEHYAAAGALVLKKENSPKYEQYVDCWAGRDRTGTGYGQIAASVLAGISWCLSLNLRFHRFRKNYCNNIVCLHMGLV